MRRPIGRLVTIAAVAAAATLAAAGQTPQGAEPSGQQPVFRARTDLVSVYVVATDFNDQAVHGLTKEDFTVTDRKKPQSIEVFDEVAVTEKPTTPAFTLPPTLKRDVASNNVDLSDRLVVVVVDDLHIFKDRADRSKNILRMLVDKLGPKTPMAVLFTSGKKGVPVTEDRALVLQAIDTLKGERLYRRPAEAIDRQMPGVMPQGMDARRAALGSAMSTSLQDFFDNMAYYKTLEDAARLLAADDGRRKTFVVISEGIGKDMAWVPEMIPPTETGGQISRDPTSVNAGYHDYAILDMLRAMRRSNVATYAIDPRGQVTNENLMKECSPHLGAFGDSDPCSSGLTHMNSILRLAQQGLVMTADVTGGFAVTDSDDFEGGVDKIVSDLDNYYLLGFYPKDAKGNGMRELMVTVDVPGVLLRFRQGYEVGAAPPPPKTNNPLTALALGMVPKRDLPLRLVASAFPGQGKTARVAATIEVTAPRHDLEDANQHVADQLRYSLLVAEGKGGKVLKQLQNSATITSNRPLGESAPAGITYQMPMGVELPAGRYQFRASAISSKLSRSGSVFLDVEVPDFTKDPVALSDVAIGYADGPRVTQARPPNAMQVVPFDASLDREFHATDTVRVFFEVARRSPATTKVAVELVDYSDHVVTTLTPTVGGSPQVGQVDIRLPLKGLTPGAYRVRATATTGGTTARREVGLIIR